MGLATTLALASAALHVTWNLLLKLAPPEDRDLTSWGLFAFGGVLALPLAVALGGPGWAAAPWLALSGVVHVIYVTGLVASYRHGDFSLAYPLARGGGAVVAAAGGVLFLGDHLALSSVAAIAVVGAGLISLVDRQVRPLTIRDALLTAAAIGTYTVVDAHGARVSADGLAYGFSSVASAGAVVSVWYLGRGRLPALRRAWPDQGPRWVVAGACTAVAYSMVLLAMRHASVGYVAMLRESSVVLGALIGWLVLREPLGGRRLVSSAVVVVGLLALIVTTV